MRKFFGDFLLLIWATVVLGFWTYHMILNKIAPMVGV